MSGISLNDTLLMDLTINKAWEYQGIAYPNPAVASLVTDRYGQIIALEAHQRSGTSHAEVLTLLKAYEHLTHQKAAIDRFDSYAVHEFLLTHAKDTFKGCSIYVTLEPCSHIGKTPSCAVLIGALGLKKVAIGMIDPIDEHSGGVEMMRAKGIEVIVDVQPKRTQDLIEPFSIWQKRAFVLFKLAQSHNGKIGGGYLSTQESLTHTHKLRHSATKMVIGGNTVRIDRPTLDCRLIEGGEAPHIYIYSKENNFDREIPLFNIPNRNVEIGSDLSFLDTPSFVLVEGGMGTLNALKDKIDWMLTYQTPKIIDNSIDYRANIDLETLHAQRSGVDRMIWSRVKH
ncbi:MAG: bifunctional diaminohydroxyphosphoribosylaminopyrimidine deaminase/5-amino-6-(5-phosphoribosylamino)uracil reductase RibD [Campylobacterales bacterium]|nr:bifunctional diaminohydroxyphosphoribosylaminopyrimidine deaminase/5-amino-6-(5-phosphoribosylamino)uracil reductase RibD [Campylobacterales bacterium]